MIADPATNKHNMLTGESKDKSSWKSFSLLLSPDMEITLNNIAIKKQISLEVLLTKAVTLYSVTSDMKEEERLIIVDPDDKLVMQIIGI